MPSLARSLQISDSVLSTGQTHCRAQIVLIILSLEKERSADAVVYGHMQNYEECYKYVTK